MKFNQEAMSLRNALWEKYKEENPPKGQAKLYYTDNAQYWKDGYECGYMEHRRQTIADHKIAMGPLLANITFLENRVTDLMMQLDQQKRLKQKPRGENE